MGEEAFAIAVSGSFNPCPRQRHRDSRTAREKSLRPVLAKPRDARRRGGLDEHAFLGRQQLVRVNDFCIAHHVNQAARFIASGFRLFPTRGIADAYGGGDGFRLFNRMPADNGRGALGLESDHLGRGGNGLAALILLIAFPVGRNVARVADRQQMKVRRPAQRVADLERGRLLAFDTIGIDRIDDVDL